MIVKNIRLDELVIGRERVLIVYPESKTDKELVYRFRRGTSMQELQSRLIEDMPIREVDRVITLLAKEI